MICRRLCDINANSCNKLLSYARRVRSINFDDNGPISIGVIKILTSLGLPTFPALAVVRCYTSLSRRLSIFEPLWSVPSLRRLIIWCRHPTDRDLLVRLGDVLRQLPQISPDLKHLFISSHGSRRKLDTSFLHPILAESLPRFLQLELIAISGFGCAPYVLSAVSLSPRLDNLFLDFEDTIQDIPISASDSFPELGSLNVTARAQMCINVVASLRLVGWLQISDLCLNLNSYFQEVSDVAPELAQSIQAVLSPTLTKLAILAKESLDACILPPLFKCRRLEVVYILINFDSKKRGSDAIAMAHIAWPELHNLDLGVKPSSSSSDFESEFT